MPLPPPLGSGAMMIWRADDARYARTWHRGTGAKTFGGRWNSIGHAVIYASLDPATAILEVAVHRGFRFMDAMPHVLTGATLVDPASVHVVTPENLPERWLAPRAPTDTAPQAFGDDLLARFPVVLFPSIVSRHSWNAVLRVKPGVPLSDIRQEPLIIDPRLHSGPDVRPPQ